MDYGRARSRTGNLIPVFALPSLVLSVARYGNTADPKIVLLHGWPLNRSIWSGVGPVVAAKGFRVLCPDLPGFGESPLLPPDRWTVEAYADEVAVLLRSEAAEPIPVAGHSFGGYVALALADRYLARLSGLGLIASRTMADSEAARRGRLETIQQVRSKGTAALLPDLAVKLLAPSAPADSYERAANLIAKARPEAVVAGLTAMAARTDRTWVAESLRKPVLVVHGAADQLVPAEQAFAASRPSGHSRVRILPGVGHMPMWEAPVETAAEIAAWADSAHRL